MSSKARDFILLILILAFGYLLPISPHSNMVVENAPIYFKDLMTEIARSEAFAKATSYF